MVSPSSISPSSLVLKTILGEGSLLWPLLVLRSKAPKFGVLSGTPIPKIGELLLPVDPNLRIVEPAVLAVEGEGNLTINSPLAPSFPSLILANAIPPREELRAPNP